MSTTKRIRYTGSHLAGALSSVGVFMVFFILGSFSGKVEGATTDLGYRFNTTNMSVSDCTSNYGSAISSTVMDYNNNTDLTMSLIPFSCTLITYTEGNYGNTPWHAVTIARNSSGSPCANFSDGSLTGNCNTTTQKAASGTIYFNDYPGVFPSTQKNWAARHEMGHMFGMGHVTSCTPNSVMKTPDCASLPSTLTSSDTNVINGWY